MLTPLQQSVESTVQFIVGTFNLRFFDQNLSTKYICVRCPHTRIKLCSVFRLLKPKKAKVTIFLFRSDTERISLEYLFLEAVGIQPNLSSFQAYPSNL